MAPLTNALFGFLFVLFCYLIVAARTRQRVLALTLTGLLVVTLVSPPPAQAQGSVLLAIQSVMKVINGAINTALKAINSIRMAINKFYQEVVNGELKPVLNTLVTIRKQGTWSEIVYLVVPTLNDSDQEFRGLARWVKSELGPDVPLHFSQFHPEYLLKNLPLTPVPTLERAKAICDAEGLHYVYIGNVPGHPAESTYCPKCRRVVVERAGFAVRAVHLNRGKCQFCQQAIPGVWDGLLHL